MFFRTSSRWRFFRKLLQFRGSQSPPSRRSKLSQRIHQICWRCHACFVSHVHSGHTASRSQGHMQVSTSMHTALSKWLYALSLYILYTNLLSKFFLPLYFQFSFCCFKFGSSFLHLPIFGTLTPVATPQFTFFFCFFLVFYVFLTPPPLPGVP